jgi:hypothetical protein
MPWNKPKGSTYNSIMALDLDLGNGPVEHSGIRPYEEDEIRAWAARFPLTCADERNAKALEYLIARVRASKHITYKVVEPGEPRQSEEEQNMMIRKITAFELQKLRAEKGGA